MYSSSKPRKEGVLSHRPPQSFFKSEKHFGAAPGRATPLFSQSLKLYKKCAQLVENRLENHVHDFPQMLRKLLITLRTLRLFRYFAGCTHYFAHIFSHNLHMLQTKNTSVICNFSPFSTQPITTTTMYINKEEIV